MVFSRQPTLPTALLFQLAAPIASSDFGHRSLSTRHSTSFARIFEFLSIHFASSTFAKGAMQSKSRF
ncbi:unnamed protein product [Linum trigynum]|uniref:Secreted protein n=1 Tax=Linum trigynum TaxID=586398 RepID=A0AAV2G497_9ROSI